MQDRKKIFLTLNITLILKLVYIFQRVVSGETNFHLLDLLQNRGQSTLTYNLPHDLETSVVGTHGIFVEWLTSLS